MPTTRPGFIWSGTEWVAIGQEAVVNPFYYQATAPSSPATGDIWIESDVDVPSIDSAQFLRWRKTMTGGQTSLSGNDDSSLPLQYTPGYEQLYINGVLQVRGGDYTATTGTTVTGLTALVANDVVEIFSAVARTVADVYTQTQSDARFAPKTGNVIQKIVTPYTTYSSHTSSVDVSGFSVSITPKFANSKIFISAVSQVGASATGQIMGIQLKENGTNLSFQTAIARIVDVGTTFTCAFATQRTPNSIATLTYQISFVYGGSGTGYINGHSFNATGTSAITVEEIAQ